MQAWPSPAATRALWLLAHSGSEEAPADVSDAMRADPPTAEHELVAGPA
jgi:hypothetical protein